MAIEDTASAVVVAEGVGGGVTAADTTTTTAEEVLAASLSEATKLAEMLSLPTGSSVVASVATPLAFNGAAPTEVAPL